ncbi:SDR family oxidoreductase [Vibrio vulnificus]|nr:SDR family oxidoreductase [Vibrio vulnificus]POC45020.1 short-chain dehydrogenase [Vibrio vulnificus]POC62056.1 short-chain dehydrogenase [Vibrio vulnificus]RZQ04880.1 SDR family oxidoreductase [Vibrio vulnificus]HAS6347772.1 SDR family oxidoreductase [Vibrio vulnificus]
MKVRSECLRESNEMDIKNALILVTSAGSLLGRTVAAHFARLGAIVILCDQDQTSLSDTHKELYAITQDVYPITLQDYSQSSIQSLFDHIQAQFNRVPNVLVNCWTSSPLPLLNTEATSEGFIEKLSSTAGALYGYVQVCAERMRRTETKGVIVNVISHDDHLNFTGVESVTSLVSGFTHSWAKELTPFNIRVGGVIPSVSHHHGQIDATHWAQVQDELIRNAEYIVANEYFSGRVVTTEI